MIMKLHIYINDLFGATIYKYWLKLKIASRFMCIYTDVNIAILCDFVVHIYLNFCHVLKLSAI